VPFTVVVSGAPELEQGDPELVALANGLAKARAVAVQEPSATVIGCDTVVALDGRLYGKPADESEARSTLSALSGRTHVVLSGLAVLSAGRELTALERTRVSFRELDGETIERFVAVGEWRERSGGYAIQGQSAALVKDVDGDIDNVVGLPLARLLELCPELAGGA